MTPPDAPTARVAVPLPTDATNKVVVHPAATPPPLPADQPTNRVSRVNHAAEEKTGFPPTFPEVGARFLGFRLVEELGRGAFGRVYLAYQGDLAGRPVALKVAPDIFGESQTLAQLQHTNIVPIYSLHQAGPYQAVCMPFFGRTTLSQVLAAVSGRGTLPHSGRELVSTLNRRSSETSPPSGWRSNPAPAAPAPAPAPAPAGAAHSPDGWARLEGLSYVEAVLWIGAQLADGLAHAHARGILHSDLKPANVLLTDDGRPMLLDFNLAADTKGQATRAGVGGTLPYMAPEHLRAFRDRTGGLDERCDLFSLGVILFELLTGRHPYPVRRGPAKDTVAAMLADREQAAPSVRKWNPAVSPAAEAVVRKLLAPDPAARYQTAEQLREDVDRHLTHRPLRYGPNPSAAERVRKWARRHPRLSSSATVGGVAAVLLAALGAGAFAAWDRQRERTRLVELEAAADRDKAADLRALGVLGDHRVGFADARLLLASRDRSAARVEFGLDRLRGVLERYGVPDDDGADAAWTEAEAYRHLPAGERERVRADVGEAFYLMAQLEYGRAVGATFPADRATRLALADRRAAAAARYAGDRLPRAVAEQRAAVADLRGDAAAARRFREAVAGAAPTARDEYLLGVQLAHRNEYRRAVGHLDTATRLDASNFSAWFTQGNVHLHLEQPEFALACYGACVAIRDDVAAVWRNRGFAHARMRQFDRAVRDYDRAAELDPNDPETYLARSDARFTRNDLAGAEADLTRALATGRAPVRAYFLRANVRHWRRDAAGATADRTAGLALTPTDPFSWVGRAEQRAAADPAAALTDVEAALKLDPLLLDGLQMKAHLLTELKRADEATAVLDRAVHLYPDSAPARAGRGVLLARRGQRDAALRDAKDALLLDTRAPNLYQVGCIYALTSPGRPDDRREALALLWPALKTGYGLDIVDTDTDLDPLRADPEFRRVVAQARELQRNPRR